MKVRETSRRKLKRQTARAHTVLMPGAWWRAAASLFLSQASGSSTAKGFVELTTAVSVELVEDRCGVTPERQMEKDREKGESRREYASCLRYMLT